MKVIVKFSVSFSGQVTLSESLDLSPGQLSLLFNGKAGRTSPGVCGLCGGHCGPTSLVIKEHSSCIQVCCVMITLPTELAALRAFDQPKM